MGTSDPRSIDEAVAGALQDGENVMIRRRGDELVEVRYDGLSVHLRSCSTGAFRWSWSRVLRPRSEAVMLKVWAGQ